MIAYFVTTAIFVLIFFSIYILHEHKEELIDFLEFLLVLSILGAIWYIIYLCVKAAMQE